MLETDAKKDTLNSLAKGLEVIVTMGKHDSLTMSELVEITGMNRWLVRRIILTLESLGYVGKEKRSFRLLPKVMDLGHAFMFSMDLWKVADPLVAALVDEVRLSCTMALLESADIVYIIRRTTSQPSVTIPLQVGSRIPAHCTASGMVLLSGLTDEDLDQWLVRAPLVKLTAMTETRPDFLKARIREAGEQGWSRVDHELAPGSCSVAMPVRDRAGKILSSISLSGRQEELEGPAIMEHLRRTAGRIESVLHRR